MHVTCHKTKVSSEAIFPSFHSRIFIAFTRVYTPLLTYIYTSLSHVYRSLLHILRSLSQKAERVARRDVIRVYTPFFTCVHTSLLHVYTHFFYTHIYAFFLHIFRSLSSEAGQRCDVCLHISFTHLFYTFLLHIHTFVSLHKSKSLRSE